MFFRILALIGFMAVGIYGATSLQQFDMPQLESLSGEWGDLPETNALVSIHLIWFLVIVPPMVFAVLSFPQMRRRSIWLIVTLIAFLTLAGWIGYSCMDFARENPDAVFESKQLLFFLLQLTDYPLLAVFIGGFVSLILSWGGSGKSSEETVEPSE